MVELVETRSIPSADQRPLTGVELLTIAYRALSPIEQDEALDRLGNLRLEREAGEQTQTERMISSLQRVRELVGHSPTVTDYREAVKREMRGEIELGLEPLSQLIPHFGSWRMAREALDLSATTTPRRIEAMFRNRRVGRVHRYSDQTLRETLQRAGADLGHPPQTNEYSRWRHQEIETARASGEKTFQLPSVGAFRSHWGGWENVLTECGFSAGEIAARSERS
jgi:hypothetical protein